MDDLIRNLCLDRFNGFDFFLYQLDVFSSFGSAFVL